MRGDTVHRGVNGVSGLLRAGAAGGVGILLFVGKGGGGEKWRPKKECKCSPGRVVNE